MRVFSTLAAPRRAARAKLMATTVLVGGMMLGGQAPAQTLPSGGQVVAGQAVIGNAGGRTVISQSSDKAIVNWTDFSIGQGGEVDFDNGSGATLNRVTGGNLSSLDGVLKATGSVYLINPNGVIIGKNGVVSVGGDFVASALDVSNADFLSGGDLTFSGPSLASVVNLGKIGALGGDVALMAVDVRNGGEIDAANGTAGLIAGRNIIMRDSSVDDGRFLVVTGGSDTAATNDGMIAAAAAELRAEGGNVYALAGNTEGVIRATGVADKGGRIWLTAGAAGSVAVSGSALTAGDGGGNGGAITVAGGQVTVASDATLDASATGAAGHGGEISVIADKASGDLTFAGTALAKGGERGGQVETSGARVDFDGARVDASAVDGPSGVWLIDPYDLTIDAAAASTLSGVLDGNTDVTLQTTASGTSGPGTANAAGNGDIFVNSDISWSSIATLMLDAYRSVQFNANVTATGAGKAVIKTNDGGSGGDYYFALGKSLSLTTSGSLSINGAGYTLINSLTGIQNMLPSGNYALIGNLSGGSYADNVYSGTFSGVFTGLGHTFDGLTITNSGGDDAPFYAIGSSGVLRDLGVTNLMIDTGGGSSDASGVVAYNQGTIANVWTTGSIAGMYAGGISAENAGTIRNSFSAANITSYGDTVGGLVGYNDTGGHIIDSYAAGTVTNATGFAGGLVGQNAGDIATSYASGLVTGSGTNGGLVALDQGGAVANSYWDTTTSGQSLSAGGTGMTTSDFQNGNLPSGFSASVWTVSSGAYPQLSSFVVPAVSYQTVGGMVYDGGGSAASGATVALYSGGSLIGTSSGSASDGTYSISLTPGTITSSTAVGGLLTLSGASGVSGLIYTDAPVLTGGNLSGFDLHAGLIDLTTGASGYIALQSLLNTTFGTTNLSGALAAITNPDYRITASGAFTLDADLTGGGAVAIKTGGDLTLDNPVTVSGGKALTLDAHDNLYINANLTASGSDAVTIATADGGTGDYYFALGDSLGFTGSGGSLTINNNAYTLLYSLGDLTGIDGGSGRYALGANLSLSSNASSAIVNSFSGALTGLGHTISGLNITGNSSNVGLIGSNSGVVRDIGLTTGSVTGGGNVGALVGDNQAGGVIKNDWSTVAVDGASYASNIGGLVGQNSGAISNSFTNAIVGGRSGYGQWTGGLVGWNIGSITNSYATGAVTGYYYTGGLVGQNVNPGTISNAYATGFITDRGGGHVGGLVGGSQNPNVLLSNSYYDTTTSGQGGYGISETTSDLQSASLASLGFDSTVWSNGSGLYPYLKSFFPKGVQAISGTATTSSGASAVNAAVSLYTGGNVFVSAYSGANGYYYAIVAPDTITSSTAIGGLLTLNGASSVSGLAYANAPTLTSGNVTGVNIKSGLIDLTTDATGYSALQSLLGATFGSSNLNSALAGITNPDYKITASGAFTFDQVLSFGGGLDVTATGGITLSQNLTTAGTTRFENAVTLGGDVTLQDASGSIAFMSTIDGASRLTLKGASLSFNGAIGGTMSLTALTGAATAGDITVGGQINVTHGIVLAANGVFTNTAGASALNAGDGFTIYTQNAADPTGTLPVNGFGGLTATNYYNDAYDFSAGTFASAVPAGDHFVYAYAASLTPTLSGSAGKTYDAGVTADTSGLSVAAGTLLSADDSVTLTISGARYDTKNAGTGKTVTADIAFASNPNNYALSSTTAAAAVGSIDKAALTLAAATDTKTYDANADSTVLVSVGGLQGADTVTGLAQSFDSKNAGSRTLSVNSGYIVNDGNSGGNYTVTTQTASGSITKAALTLAAATDTKTYDANADSTGTVSVSGLQGSDTVTGLTQSFDSKNAGSRTLSINGGYAVNDGNSGGNYTVTTQTALGTIAKAALTLAAATDTKTYDANADSTATVSVSGLQGSDTVTGLTQSFDAKNAGSRTLSINGGYAVNDGNSGGNYTITTQTASGTIAKAALTLSAAADTKTYDANTDSMGLVSIGGLQGSDTVTGLSQSFDSKNAGSRTLSVNGGYVVNDGNSGGNYTVTTQTASGMIDKAALTLAAMTDAKTYDATTNSTGTVMVSGLQGSDTVTGLSQSFDSKNAGSRILSVNSGYIVNDGNNGGNYTVATQTASGTIAKAALTLSAVTDTKTYDANVDSLGLVSVGGLQGADTVTGLLQSFDSKNAGSRTLSVSRGYVVNDGNSGGNYRVTTQTASGAIGRASLTLAAAADMKTYDATTGSAGMVSVSGLQGSDTVTGLSQSFDSKNAGSRILSVNSSYFINDGSNGGNYTIATQTASGTIAKAALTLAAVTDTKTYDANADSAGTVLVSGLQGSDTVTGLTQSFDSKNAGSRTLSVNGGYAINDGNSGRNYTVTTQTASGAIAKAALTLAAVTDTKIYDANADSTGLVSVGGLQGSDTITSLAQSFDSKNAGSRTLNVNGGYVVNDGNSGGNYTVTTQTALGTIAKAALTLAAAADTKTYDATAGSAGTVSVSGLQGSDTVTGLSQSFDSKNAGSRTLIVNGGYIVNDGNSGGNYAVTTRAASGTIDRAALILAAASDTKTYDAATGSTGAVGVSGLQGSDTVTGLSQSFDSKNAGSRTLIVNGGYVVNDGDSGGNYAVTTQTASGSIAKAALTAGLTGVVEKVYDATADADLTAANYTLSGVMSGDEVALNAPSAGVYAGKDAGSGRSVSVGGIALTGVDAGNYTVNASASADIGVIDQRPITVAADDLGKIVGAADPALTWKLASGDLVGGDAVTGGLTRASGETPGDYAITQGSLAASSNYKVTFTGATFTITPTGLQNQPIVNPVQNTAAPPPAPAPDNGSGSSASGSSGSDSSASGGSASSASGGEDDPTDPNVHHGSSSSDTCVTGEACSNQPYPGNQQFSSYVSFLSH